LPGHTHRVFAFFDKARIIDHQHTMGTTHLAPRP
jgi:hypothetical protein